LSATRDRVDLTREFSGDRALDIEAKLADVTALAWKDTR
jgi:hypothetical protein